jgi:putative ABC transport system ATP-binding protein
MAVAIAVEELHHEYPTAAGSLTVLDGLSLRVPAGGHVALTGPSGSGKSTLLSILGGLEPPQAGSVVVGGHQLADLAGDDLAAYRRTTVGFVFQHFGLLDTLTAVENVELTLMLSGRSARARRTRAMELLDALGMVNRSTHRPHQLSGGERQRVAIARAVANEPQLVLADEPTGNLDEEASEHVADLLDALPARHGCTLVVVTHNRTLAARAPVELRLAHGRVTSAAEAPQ